MRMDGLCTLVPNMVPSLSEHAWLPMSQAIHRGAVQIQSEFTPGKEGAPQQRCSPCPHSSFLELFTPMKNQCIFSSLAQARPDVD